MEPTVDINLPQPPPSRAALRHHARTIALRPGHLLSSWATMFWLGWLLVGCSFGAVWYSSRVTGLSTWWLGPETEPRLFLLNVAPFVAPFTLSFFTLRSARYLPWWGVLGAIVSAGIAAGDLADQPGYAVVEFALAGAGLLISLAAFAGMLRPAAAAADDAQGPAVT